MSWVKKYKKYGLKTTSMMFLNCTWNKCRGTLLVIGSFLLTQRRAVQLCLIDWSCLLDLTSLFRKNKKCHSYLFFGDTKAKIGKEKFQYLKTVKLKISCRRKSQLVVSRKVVTNQCCGLAVIFCHFISHQLVAKTKNILEIFSGVHGFTGKTVKALFQMNFYCGGKLLLWLVSK